MRISDWSSDVCSSDLPNQRSIINQREVGQDTVSYERALKSSLREAPDVILVGEVRTRETMDACIQLANTGHLAISTLHANTAYQALQRIVNQIGRATCRERVCPDV